MSNEKIIIKTPPGHGWRCKCGQLNAVHRIRCLRDGGWNSEEHKKEIKKEVDGE